MSDPQFERLLGLAAYALANGEGPVIYVHPNVGGPARCCVVDQDWLSRVWDAACEGGYEDPALTAAGVRERFLPHGHIDPADADMERFADERGYDVSSLAERTQREADDG